MDWNIYLRYYASGHGRRNLERTAEAVAKLGFSHPFAKAGRKDGAPGAKHDTPWCL